MSLALITLCQRLKPNTFLWLTFSRIEVGWSGLLNSWGCRLPWFWNVWWLSIWDFRWLRLWEFRWLRFCNQKLFHRTTWMYLPYLPFIIHSRKFHDIVNLWSIRFTVIYYSQVFDLLELSFLYYIKISIIMKNQHLYSRLKLFTKIRSAT